MGKAVRFFVKNYNLSLIYDLCHGGFLFKPVF